MQAKQELEIGQYVLEPIQKQNIQQMVDFIRANYVIKQPLSLHCKSTPQQFCEVYHLLFIKSCQSGYSFCFRQQGKIVSIILAMDLKTYAQPIKQSPHFAAIEAIIMQNQTTYQPICEQKALSIFIGCTDVQHQGKGLFRGLVEQVIKKAKQNGIKQITADCTNRGSQSVLTKVGFQIIAKTFYDQFEFEGKFPFKGIKGTDYLSFVVKRL